jgi:hypothetical protein
MKRNDKVLFVFVGIVAAIISLIVSSALFSSPAKRSTKAPVVEIVPTTFPDVKNDSNYNTFLNSKALDPTQPVQIGNTQNTTPFH